MSSGFYVDGSVAIIDKAYLLNMPKLQKQLTRIGNECGYKFRICGSFYTDCKVVYVVYLNYIRKKPDGTIVKLGNMKNQQQVVESKADLVTSYLSCYNISQKNIAEIYDVCTRPLARGRGHMREIFNVLEEYLKKAQVSKMWLGVDLNNPMWKDVVKLYVNLGFRDPKITKRTPGGARNPFKVLRLIKNIKSIELEKKEIIDASNKLRDEYFLLKQEYKRYIVIPKDVLHAIGKAYIPDEKVEYAGALFCDRIIPHIDKEYHRLVYPLDSEIRGSDKEFIVQTPTNVAFSFHTHPDICYTKLECYIGWPSAQDMVSVVAGYDYSLREHFVITKEGVYGIQMTKNFIGFWKQIKLQYCREAILSYVNSVFANFESKRKKQLIKEMIDAKLQLRKEAKEAKQQGMDIDTLFSPTPTEEKLQNATFKEYGIIVNTLTLYNIINSLSTSFGEELISKCTKYYKDFDDFPMFRVAFSDWKTIEKNDGFFDEIDVYKGHETGFPNCVNFVPNNNSFLSLYERHRTTPDTFYYSRPIITLTSSEIKSR